VVSRLVEFSLPRGLRDIPPEEASAAEEVRRAFLDTCRLFDYKVMEPSSLELLETLEARSGPGIRDEIYHFKDKSARDLGLRFDLTVGITRYVATRRDLGQPARIGSYASVWRYDEPQYGRYRWFYQWDAELYGPSNAEADAEVIEFTHSLFRRLGTKPMISIGSRKVIESFVRKNVGISEEEKLLDSFRAVDKLAKKSLDDIAKEYSTSLNKGQLQRIAEFAERRGDPGTTIREVEKEGIDASDLSETYDALKNRGVRDVEINLGIVRGIDYYTGMVFEAYDAENPRLGSLCGGGRYDSLPAVYGRADFGATGVAGGIERAILAYKFQKDDHFRVFVAPIGKERELLFAASSVASELRSAGIAAQSEITGRSLRKILETQSAAGVSAVIILGQKEIAEHSAKIKWMDSGEEVTVTRSDLASTIIKQR
jgi:histidyl-tRNA synthetase